jgi:iron complex transport system ATP-binding protein
MLARAVVRRPSLLLLDEPAAGLDIPSRESLVGALEDRGALDGIPSILATHHVEEIPGTTTHVGLLRSGRLLASGTANAVLADDPLTECFEVPLRVARNGDRWSVVADR